MAGLQSAVSETKSEMSGDRRRDSDLLRLYVDERSEAAFAELGRRYAGLVYSTCLRELGEQTLAEDAAQGVFLLLSRKAGSLRKLDSLAGWLYAASRYIASNLRKQERKRMIYSARAHDESMTAMEPNGMARNGKHNDAGHNPLWERVEPHFYDVLNRLKPVDREAILLRFVQEQSFNEVGASLGVPENTARMRVNRALEKVRAQLAKAGIALTIGALALMLDQRTAQAAPIRVLQSLTQIVAAGTLSGGSTLRPTIPRRAALRYFVKQAVKPLIGFAVGFLILCSFIGYRYTRPKPLDADAEARLFASFVGVWQGSLEYADDRTSQHSTYQTSVVFSLRGGGNALGYVSTYGAYPIADTTVMIRDPKTGSTTITNGGAERTHTLAAVGEILHERNGSFHFQGRDEGRNVDTRMQISLDNNRLILQEEYRRSGDDAYRFRNRYTLNRK